MLAVDIRIQEVQAKHRCSLFRLIKLELGDLEPVYTKIPGVVDISKGRLVSSQLSPAFGSMLLVADNTVTMEHLHSEISIHIEIYDDQHGPLDLICAGEKILSLERSLFVHRPSDVRSRMLRKISQSDVLKVPIRHFTQGKFQLSAGQVLLSVTVYRICDEMLREWDLNSINGEFGNKAAEMAATEAISQPSYMENQSFVERIEIPEILTAEEINTRLGYTSLTKQSFQDYSNSGIDNSTVNEHNEDDVNTTREDSWMDEFQEDDHNSVDEFVQRFLSRRQSRHQTSSSSLSDRSRSGSPPPPPPPPLGLHPSNKQQRTAQAGRNKKVNKQRNPSTIAIAPAKAKRTSPHLIGAAADRGRWLFSRPPPI